MRHFSQNKKRQLPPPRPVANPFAQFRSPSPDDGGGTNTPRQRPKPHTHTKPGRAAAPLPHPQQPSLTEDKPGREEDMAMDKKESQQEDDNGNDVDGDKGEDNEEEEEEDYLTMALPTTTTTTTSSSTTAETSLQRRQRLAKEGLARGRVPSKAELAAQERQRREEGLARSLFFEKPRGEEDEVIRVGGLGGSASARASAATAAVNGAGNAAPASRSKGLAMMAKMGFRPGERLGAARKDDGAGNADKAEDDKAQDENADQKTQNNHAITEPIRIHIRENRSGIGLEDERKRKLQDAADVLGLNNDTNTTGTSNTNKKAKIEDEADYRVRMARERDAARKEKLVTAAQKIAERMDEDGHEAGEGDGDTDSSRNKKVAAAAAAAATRPLTSIPVVYRSLVRNREQAERDRRMRHDLETSLGTSTSTTTRHSSSKLPTYQEDEDTFDSYDRIALGEDDNEGHGLETQVNGRDDNGNQRGPKAAAMVHMPVDDLDDEDTELEAFEALDVGERLAKLVAYLRDKYRYCFWCKFAYADEEMEGCPGPEEEDHD